jgi:hypothetical protein
VPGTMLRAVVVRASALIGLSALTLAPSALASGDCVPGFERWVQLSESRMRYQRTGDARTGSDQWSREETCVASEGVRQELLRALVRVGVQCEAASEPAAKHTKKMIDINESVITALPLCRLGTAQPPPPPPAPPGWVTGVIAAPKPSSPPLAKEPPTAPAPAAKPPAQSNRQCLELASASQESYVIANKQCVGQTVLAIVERRDPSGETECKGYFIYDKLVLTGGRPQVHYECSMKQPNCTRDRIAKMFPECN